MRTSATTAVPTSSSTPSTSAALTSTTPHTTTASPITQETADRAAIQAVWIKYWTVGDSLQTMPESQWRPVMSEIATGSVLSGLLAGAAQFKQAGKADWGVIYHRQYWTAPVAGKSTAVMGDCMDDSQGGSMNAKTGQKLTMGVPRDNTMGTFTKGADGQWRVSKIEFLVNIKC